MSKAEAGRIVALGDKFIANSPENGKAYMTNFFEKFKVAAHVGVYFYELSYEDALKMAKQQGRKLFIDCYTTWCGPCKYMSETVFKQENVGDFLNQNFICLKYDLSLIHISPTDMG